MNITLSGQNLTNSSKKNERRPTDFYETPEDVTQVLLDYLSISTHYKIWEPACGEGKISKVLKENNYDVLSSDIRDVGYEAAFKFDFLNGSLKRGQDWIITNPPFSLAEQFIGRCLLRNGSFALLLKSQYWHAKKRTALFKSCRPKYILALNWRPDFLYGERGGNPTMECFWCVWESPHKAATIYDILERPTKGGW